jgi:hypothetical protein
MNKLFDLKRFVSYLLGYAAVVFVSAPVDSEAIVNETPDDNISDWQQQLSYSSFESIVNEDDEDPLGRPPTPA